MSSSCFNDRELEPKLTVQLASYSTRYRELVGTAETIVEMNKEIKDVEGILTDVGRRCNPRLVEKKHQHARQMKKDAANLGKLQFLSGRKCFKLTQRDRGR